MDLNSIIIKGIINIKELKFCPECGESNFLNMESVYTENIVSWVFNIKDEKELKNDISLVTCTKCNSSYFVGEHATSKVRLAEIPYRIDSISHEKV